jgi:hypothetical protein
MEERLYEDHKLDDQGRPAGGFTHGIGITINWQAVPLGRGEGRRSPTGAFVEGVIQAAVGRLQFYQATPRSSAARTPWRSRICRRASTGCSTGGRSGRPVGWRGPMSPDPFRLLPHTSADKDLVIVGPAAGWGDLTLRIDYDDVDHAAVEAAAARVVAILNAWWRDEG